MIFQDTIPYDVTAPRPLPGIQPMPPEEWLRVDEAYAGQVAERLRLVTTQCDAVHALEPEAEAPAQELLDMVLSFLATREDFGVADNEVQTPDNRVVTIDRKAPLLTLAGLVQEDFCILTKEQGAKEHRLTGALLCFPASWTLSEKIGKPLMAVHDPVPEYAPVAARVQRLFDGIQVGRPLERFNVLWYDDPALFQPRSSSAPRAFSDPNRAAYLRSERQSLTRLPESRAVVFAIHTYLLRRAAIEAVL